MVLLWLKLLMKNKKEFKKTNIVKFYLLSTLLLLLTNSPVLAQPLVMNAFVKENIANIREKPEINSNVILSVPKSEKLNVLDVNDKDDWYKVSLGNKSGWINKNSINLSIPTSVEYKNVSFLGTNKETGIIKNAIKIFSNGLYKYILDDRGNKPTLIIYNQNNEYVKNIPFFYYWVNNSSDFKNLLIAVDNENNIYTNSSARNIIAKYDFNGNKLAEVKIEAQATLKDMKFYNDSLFILDANAKTIKVFDKKLDNTQNIFLTESFSPQNFEIKNNSIFLLDQNEEKYTTYYVDSYSFSFRSAPNSSASIIENLPKGSIIKAGENSKETKVKNLENNDPNKIQEQTWLEITENNKKKFADLKELKKVNFYGKVNVYNMNGTFIERVSFDEKIILKNNDKHKNISNEEINRKILSITATSKKDLILAVLSKTKNSDAGIINLYFFDKDDKTYKISNQIPYSQFFDFYLDQKEVYHINNNGFIDIFDLNGLEIGTLGRKNNLAFNLPENIFFYDNSLCIFDKSNYSLGLYDLNGEPYKVKSSIQKGDNFNIIQVFYKNNYLYLLKTIENEEKKLGIEIYTKDLTKITDKWLMSIDSNIIPKMAVNDNEEILIYGNSTLYGKKAVINILNKYGHSLYRIKTENDLGKIYSEELVKKIKENEIKFLNFDNNGNTYLLVPFKEPYHKIQKLKLNNDGSSEVLRNFNVSFFEETISYEENKEKKEKKEFTGVNGEILSILEGKNNFTYFLFKNKFSKDFSIGIYSPIGTLIKTLKLKDVQEVKGITLDNQDNIYFTDISSIKKFSNE